MIKYSDKMPKGTFNEAERHSSTGKDTGRKTLPKDLKCEDRDYIPLIIKHMIIKGIT